MLCKNISYQVNGNEKLKKIFAIKMAQEQKIIWTAKCLEEYNYNIGKDKNNWIKMANKNFKWRRYLPVQSWNKR